MDVLATQDIANDLAFRVALRQSEIRYRRLFEAAHDGVLILDSVSRKITDANPFMSRLLGYRHEELLGRRRIRGIVSTGVGRRIDVRRSPLKSRPRKKIVGRNGKAVFVHVQIPRQVERCTVLGPRPQGETAFPLRTCLIQRGKKCNKAQLEV